MAHTIQDQGNEDWTVNKKRRRREQRGYGGASTASSLATRPGPAGTVLEDTHRDTARTTKIAH